MHPILLYLFKMQLCSGILYGYYRVALYNERFHQWNRFYLLTAMVLSVMVPLLEIPLMAEEQPAGVIYLIETMPATIVAKAVPLVTTEDVVFWLTMLVCAALFIKLLWGLYKTVYTPYQKGEVSAHEEISVIITETPAAPYSFFRWLFWRSDLSPETPHGKRVLEHELTHIREKHSADKLFTELLLVVFWCNPFFWMIRKELYIIHEFLADRKAIADNNGAAFAQMILQTINVHTPSPLTNPFFSSQIKRRLKMITTSNKPQFSYLRRISALVAMIVVSFTLMLTIEKGMAQKAPPPPPPPPPVAPPPPPPPPQKISLPDSIKSIEVNTVNGQSMVTIRLKNGKVRKMQVDEAVKKGYPLPPPPPPAPPVPPIPPSPENIKPEQIESLTLDETSGKVWVKLKDKTFFDLPRLQAQCLLDASPEKVVKKQVKGWGTEKPPIIVYAGLEINQDQMAKIDPAKIERIEVLKGDQAVAAYGERARDGVIKITPKLDQYVEKPIIPTGKIAIRPNEIKGQPYIVINEKEASRSDMDKLSPNEIASMNVLKGDAATIKYGEKARDGAIEIFTRTEHDIVFTKIENMPQFPGGQAAWTEYLQKSLRYPDKAIDQGVQGVSKVSFIVNTDGSLEDFKLVEDPGYELGNEAKRILEEGPKWEPGSQNGKLVRCRVTQNITFRLE